MHFSLKQISILKVISKRNDDGSDVDMDQILDRLDYKTSKQSLQFSLRALVEHGMIEKSGMEKRRGRKRVLFGMTDLGNRHFSPLSAPAPVSVEEVIVESEISMPSEFFE